MTSEELTETVLAAVHDGLSDCFIDGFVGMVNFIGPDGERRWHLIAPEEQFLDRTMSMVQFMGAYYDEVQRLNIIDHLMGEGEDDE